MLHTASKLLPTLGKFAIITIVLAQSGCATSGSSTASTNTPWRPFAKLRRQQVPNQPQDYNEAGIKRDDPFLPASAQEKVGSDSKKPTLSLAKKDDATISDSFGSPTALTVKKSAVDLLTPFLARNDDLALHAPRRSYRYIVVHESGSELDSLASLDEEHYERFGLEKCAYHFVVSGAPDVAGAVISPSTRWKNQEPGIAAGSEMVTRYTPDAISICLTGNFRRFKPSTTQLDATRELISKLMAEYNIPSHQVLTQSQAMGDAGESAYQNPGPQFDLNQLMRDLGE